MEDELWQSKDRFSLALLLLDRACQVQNRQKSFYILDLFSSTPSQVHRHNTLIDYEYHHQQR